jgi:hypothetical protein
MRSWVGRLGAFPVRDYDLNNTEERVSDLALNDSPSSVSPSLSRPESRKLTHLRLTMRSVSEAPITTKPFCTAVGPFERALETRLPCFGGGKCGAIEFVMELAKCDGALTREKSILVRSKSITRFSVFSVVASGRPFNADQQSFI